MAKATLAGECEKDSLFESIDESYTCVEEETSAKYCAQVGYHRGLKSRTLILRDLESNQSSFFHHKPGKYKCYIYDPFKGCLHDTLKVSSDEIQGFSWSSQDIGSSHAVETQFELNKDSQEARFSKLVYKQGILSRDVKEEIEINLKCRK